MPADSTSSWRTCESWLARMAIATSRPSPRHLWIEPPALSSTSSAWAPTSRILLPSMLRPVRSRSAAGSKHCAKSLQQDDEVQPQGPLVHILDIELDALRVGQVVSAADLPEAGHARAHCTVVLPSLGVQADLPLHAGARADDAHIALEHVPQLRKLVQAEPPQDPAGARH